LTPDQKQHAGFDRAQPAAEMDNAVDPYRVSNASYSKTTVRESRSRFSQMDFHKNLYSLISLHFYAKIISMLPNGYF